jgi:radical SAM protein with 4Fe4S-binding SPASM domain
MANLTVTTTCNLECPFCFAENEMGGSACEGTDPYISLEAFERQLAFIDRSGIDHVRLIGGEPTLHPQFPELVRRAGGRHVVVFSNGLMSEQALACLERLAPSACTVLVNMNATRFADGPRPHETRRRALSVHRLGPRALLGFTIFRVAFDLEPLLELIIEAGAKRAIRLGLAQPILGGCNEFLHPKQYPAVGRRITAFADRAARVGVRLEFDCGFVRCMFSDDDIKRLEGAGADLGWRCNPILDLSPEGRVAHCFPLGGVGIPLTDDLDADDARRRLSAKVQHYRIAGIYRECSRCEYKRRGECTGGCLATAMRRFRDRPIRVSIPRRARQDKPGLNVPTMARR